MCCERLSLGPFSQFCSPSKEVRPLSLVSSLRSCLLAMMFKIPAVSAHREGQGEDFSTSQPDLFVLAPSPKAGLLEILLIALRDGVVGRAGPR